MLEPRILEERPNSRSTVLRRAVVLTPAAIFLLVLLGFTLYWRSFFGILVIGMGALPATLEAVAALRDLRAAPITTRGRVSRLWKKSRYLVFGRVDYALIGQRLFELNAVTAMELHEGDEIIIEHWPHTNTIVTVARPPFEPAAPFMPRP